MCTRCLRLGTVLERLEAIETRIWTHAANWRMMGADSIAAPSDAVRTTVIAEAIGHVARSYD